MDMTDVHDEDIFGVVIRTQGWCEKVAAANGKITDFLLVNSMSTSMVHRKLLLDIS